MSEQKSSFLSKLYSFSNSWTGTVIIVLLVIFFIAQAFVIPSGSMKRTLLIGDHLFVKKFAYGIPTPHIPWLEIPVLPDFNKNGHLIAAEGPKRGDIVVFRYPVDPRTHFVKRCVAVGGDIVQVKDKVLYIHHHEGDEYIKKNFPKELLENSDGILWVKNPYKNKFPGIQTDQDVREDMPYPPQLFNFPKTKIPDDEYFMMGDNRDHSNDSRFWGSVPYKYIEGKPWFIYFSWDKDYEVRWKRIGRFVDTMEHEEELIDMKVPLQ
jgi:signal peptidase I